MVFVLFPKVPFPGKLLSLLALGDTEQHRLVRNAQFLEKASRCCNDFEYK